MRIGIDFDNTIIDYSDIFTKQACNLGWIKVNTKKTKQQVRDAVRELPDGEIKWRKLQGLVYGKFINDAMPFDGVMEFIKRCASENIPVFVVSHKTEYAETLEEKINLREVSLNWFKVKGFLDLGKPCLDENKIFFENPRENKLRRINELQCTHFIDDLKDVLLEPEFPKNVTRILFSSNNEHCDDGSFKVCRHWSEIEELVF
ncbi:MAG: hypothetical protein KAS66_06685 [Candidatus Omnitrophica bacterium]|nr:hypothetical protein [Candidatus Omnitrophota bacterium]